jgi:hypothetical protein
MNLALVMTTSRLFDGPERIRHRSLSTRQARKICPCRRSLGEAAGLCSAEFDRRTHGTVIAPMTFTGAEALPDSAPVTDEHFLLNPWHYHGSFEAGFMRRGMRQVRMPTRIRAELPLSGMTSHPDSPVAFRVDDQLRHLSSVEVAPSSNITGGSN